MLDPPKLVPSFLIGARTGKDPDVPGIMGITGLGENITVSLTDPLELSLFKEIANRSSKFYFHKEDFLGQKFFQLKRKGNLFSLGIPIVALDQLYEGNQDVEIRKGYQNIVYGGVALMAYLKMKYGSPRLKR